MNVITATVQKIQANDFYSALKSRKSSIEKRFLAETEGSAALFERASHVFPGGYTRDALMRGPYPTFISEGCGSTLTDVDGRTRTDFWFNATSLPLGHAHPVVMEAASVQLRKGTAYYAPTEHEIALAEMLMERVPSADHIRFANSGSEAVMMGVRFARAFCRRSLIVKFEGSYHGSYDDVSWSVSPRLDQVGAHNAPLPVPETSGLAGTDERVTVLPFNDAGVLRAYVEQHHDRIAALLVEPMANRIGLLLPQREFLEEARALCDRYGIVLIFDEVISFRVGYHGVQGLMGITPDVTTLGKIIGGGFAVGAVAGRADIMALSSPDLAPRVTHAGTFNGNPMMAVAGRATMAALTPAVFTNLAELGQYARDGLARITTGMPLQVTGEGSLFKVSATERKLHDYRDAAISDKTWEALASLALLNEGFLLTTTMSGCVSTVTTRAQVDALLGAFRGVVAA